MNVALQAVHDMWYGDLYGFLQTNHWDKVALWRIPSQSIVEVIMVLEV